MQAPAVTPLLLRLLAVLVQAVLVQVVPQMLRLRLPLQAVLLQAVPRVRAVTLPLRHTKPALLMGVASRIAPLPLLLQAVRVQALLPLPTRSALLTGVSLRNA